MSWRKSILFIRKITGLLICGSIVMNGVSQYVYAAMPDTIIEEETGHNELEIENDSVTISDEQEYTVEPEENLLDDQAYNDEVDFYPEFDDNSYTTDNDSDDVSYGIPEDASKFNGHYYKIFFETI